MLFECLMEYYPSAMEKFVIESTADPYILYKYTYNYKGAVCGWASTNKQIYSNSFLRKVLFTNLFFCGHWTPTLSGFGGIQQAMFSARNMANYLAALKK